jgi:hypothetical protein
LSLWDLFKWPFNIKMKFLLSGSTSRNKLSNYLKFK